MTTQHSGSQQAVRVPYDDLLSFTTDVFASRGLPRGRAHLAASALAYGDLTGMDSHGLFNLTRLYLPLFAANRVRPEAEPQVLTDLGACMVVDADRALGLWAAAESMDTAVARAGTHGIGAVSVRNGTHFGCAGYHARRAAERGMIGMVASNCGGQRIVRPPRGSLALLGTNPLSVAAPGLDEHPFVLDMSTTAAPTGRVRVASARNEPIPAGWLESHSGTEVTDPAEFDRGEAWLRWLGGDPETGVYKGFGLGIVVELLSALLSGSGVGPAPEALDGDGTPHGRDDDIGFFVLAIAPDLLRPGQGFADAARSLFTTVLNCPSTQDDNPVRYPGWWEAERARSHLRDGVPLPLGVYEELVDLGFDRTAN